MKKFLVSLMVILCGAVPLFADDVADVRAVLMKDMELEAEGKFSESLALKTPDFVENNNGLLSSYEQCKWFVISLDGNHPEEFLLSSTPPGDGKTKPSAETMAKIREKARDPEFLRRYTASVAKFVMMMKADAALRLNTLKIIGITLERDSAVAIVEYDIRVLGKSKCRKRFTMRKVDGAWKICRIEISDAPDVAEIKSVIVKNCELTVKGDFAGVLALHTPDFQGTLPDGTPVNYQLLKWSFSSLDGKHPEEWRLVFFVMTENKGVMPDAATEAKLRKAARAPEYIEKYEGAVLGAVMRTQAGAAFRLKNLKFVSIEVDGDRATAVTETASPDFKTGAFRSYHNTDFLRKVDGKWMLYRGVSEYK